MKTSLAILLSLLVLGFAVDTTTYAQSELDKRIEATDFTDPDSLYELAAWAMGNKSGKVRKDGRKWMKEVIELDPDHPRARDMLGYVKVGDEWYTKREATKARKKLMKEEMESKGYTWFRNGWIKKTEKRSWNSKWEKDEEDIWRSYEEIMRGKGYTNYKGQWIQMGEDDRKAIEYHRKMTGQDILVVSTTHFRFHTSIPVEFVKKYTELVEKVYDWYMVEFDVEEARRPNFFGGPVHVWTFATPQQFQDWVTTYSETYAFDDEDKKQFRENPSGWLLHQKKIATIVAEEAKDIENPLLHDLGVLFFAYQTLGRYASWQSEAMGHLVEEVFSGEKFGFVNMSTRSKYANGGGIAGKDFNTKDGRPQAKSIVKRGEDIPIRELSQQTLNSLNQDHLAQGFSIWEYMYTKRKPEMVKWIKAQRATKSRSGPDIVDGAINEATGKPAADLERNWREHAKRYKGSTKS